ncbi:precorrin-4/cobalt-precorrin-4 C11-methyltransferase [Thermosipho japonicus]|uniref:Precorrin-4/cobalt-precorrin-4 C11-methyltransferase n=1 Tax=Thermosipho japonicus TaxID=90323 RepID=A0A841GID9_9BACT|nr:precorrin-4 C(11)-methyltransferase [Thermosipho japonicus]MBB6063402.1 precorrin-4/cobalt-precorrin-4 C11-methyltransferase [Thermosipho japonicus]
MVYFIGAGPGDPELLTLKGYNALKSCQVVIYAGSLVNPEILNFADKSAKVFDSSKMTLEEILSIIKQYRDENIARLHTGDPSLFGAINEQIEFLEKEGIPYKIIPGVSSMFAGAASLKRELTIPDITQTVIITRYGKRTFVPEDLEELSKHNATMVLFLSIKYLKKIVDILKRNYPNNTPISIVYKASWKDEKIVSGTLEDIVEKAGDIESTALIYVGHFLEDIKTRSKLYDKTFSHMFRKAEYEDSSSFDD